MSVTEGHTHDVIESLAETSGKATRAEAKLRGYLLTGDDTYLAPMDEYLSKPMRMADLERALAYTTTASAEATSGSSQKPAGPNVVSIDAEALREAVGTGEESRELSELYLRLTMSDLERLGAAIECEDAVEISVIAHGCAGSSATCGIVHLAHLLRTMEQMGRNRELGGAVMLHAEIQEEFARVTSELMLYQLSADNLHAGERVPISA